MAKREGDHDTKIREVEGGKEKEMASRDFKAKWIHLSVPCRHKLLLLLCFQVFP